MKLLAATLALCSSLLLAQAPAKNAKKPAPAVKTEAKPVKGDKTKPEAKGEFVASKESKVFHKVDCKFVAKIKPENRVFYTNRIEAEKVGAKPCKVCNPK